MKVLWRSDLGQGKHGPLEIVSVVTKSGSTISADLVVPLDPHTPLGTLPDDGLLEVIEAQLAAIDELSKVPPSDEKLVREHKALQEWADQFPDLIADLCAALGFAAHPVGPTGIPELDILVSLSE